MGRLIFGGSGDSGVGVEAFGRMARRRVAKQILANRHENGSPIYLNFDPVAFLTISLRLSRSFVDWL